MMINKKRILKMILMSAALISIVSGCDKNETNQEKSGQDTGTYEQVKQTGLRRLFQDEKWEEKWTTTNKDGKDMVIAIDADIEVPDLEGMSVIEIEKLPLTSGNKEMFLKAVFGESDIFYNDDEHKTKEQWQKKIDTEIQDSIDGYEMDMAIYQAEWQEEIQQLYDLKADYESNMNRAPTEYMEASNFDSDSYIGYIDGKRYTMTFQEDDESEIKSEFITIESNDYIKPSQLENAINVYRIEDSLTLELDNEKNSCQMTKEEAKIYAEKYLDAVGIPNAVCTYAEDLAWTGREYQEEPIEEEEHRITILDGYKMIFTVGVDDFSLYMDEELDSYLDYNETQVFHVYSMQTDVIVEVNDYGLICLNVRNPIKINNITGNVELLPLSDIYKIIIDSIEENPDNYGIVNGTWAEDSGIYNHLELIYFRVTDREKENHFSYIPAWKLYSIIEDSHSADSSYIMGRVEPIWINAIDGSIINMAEELSAGGSVQGSR